MNQQGQGTVTNQEVVMDGDKVLVTSTVEERLTKQDVQMQIDNIKRQKDQIVFQSKELKKTHTALTNQETKLNEILAMFTEEDLEIL